jgi:WbqC-like protein family
MSIVIMQPYVFPYIGYFQLIYAADVFVFYDDVNYINKGWINRNRILLNGKDHLFTIPCKEASQNKLIKDIEVLDDPKSMQKLLTTVKAAYAQAPYFGEVYKLIENILSVSPGTTIAELAIRSVKDICDYLGIKRVFRVSSEVYTNRELKKADRLIDICHIEGISHYINPSGGKEIYTKEYYRSKNVSLDFLIPERVEYVQFKNTFVPWLSVIDVLMFNSMEDINNKILPSYRLE